MALSGLGLRAVSHARLPRTATPLASLLARPAFRLPLGLPLPLVPCLRPHLVRPPFLPLWPPILRRSPLLLLLQAAASFPRAVDADRRF